MYAKLYAKRKKREMLSVATEVKEPAITINGERLTVGQAMTCRVALTSWLWDLDEHGLGDDEHGQKMAAAYRENAKLILAMMHESGR